jgi:hypothetical protein
MVGRGGSLGRFLCWMSLPVLAIYAKMEVTLQVSLLQGEVTEVLEMDHQLIFSSTTSEVATAASGEPAVLVEHSTQQVAITTVNYNHTGMFTSN